MINKFWETAIRQQNHFIKPLRPHYLSGRWFLIAGPWFDILNAKADNSIILSRYLDTFNFSGCILTVDMIGSVEAYWEKYRLKLSYFEIMITDPRKLPRKLPDMIFRRHRLTLVKYLIVDAWQCNSGILPADLRCPYWDDRLPEVIKQGE
jgi:hypothetical protein